MNSFYTFDMEDHLLSSAVWFTCAVQAEFALSSVKAKKAVRRKWLLFVRVQSNNISVKRGDNPHVFDKEYNASYIHATAPNRATRFERFQSLKNALTF